MLCRNNNRGIKMNRGMNRVGVGLTRRTISIVLPISFPVKGASKVRPHGSEPPVARTGHHPLLRLGWKVLPTRIGYSSSINYVRRFRCKDSNVAFTHVQSHFYRVRQVVPCHRFGEAARRSSWESELLALCLNHNNNNLPILCTLIYHFWAHWYLKPFHL